MSAYPPRLGHLVNRPVLVAKLFPTYGQAHEIDDDEAISRVERGLSQKLWEEVLAATWAALTDTKRAVDETALLEKVARSLQKRPQRPGKLAQTNPAWSAFLLLIDVNLGNASMAAQKVLESPEAQAMARKGLAEVGKFIATEITR